MTKELTVFSDIEHFAESQRMAKALTSSSLVPPHFQGDQNIGNALIGLEMAQRMGMSPLAVFQSLYVVHGRPAFSASFLIACFNASGRFTPIQYEQVGTEGQDDFGFRAISAVRATGERIEGPAVTMAIAKADGWTRNDKYKSMPALMLRYRAATWLIRQTAPEMTMGLQTAEEEQDIDTLPERNVTPPPAATAASETIMARVRAQDVPRSVKPAPTTTPEPEPEPEPEPDAAWPHKFRRGLYTKVPEHEPEPEPVYTSGLEHMRKQPPATATEPDSDHAPATEPPPAWPHNLEGTWFDSRGIAFNPDFHGFSRGDDRPAVSAQGAFRKKRGHDAEALAIYEAQQLSESEPDEESEEGESPPMMDHDWFLRMAEDSNNADDLTELDAVLTTCAKDLGETVVGVIEDAIEARRSALDV